MIRRTRVLGAAAVLASVLAVAYCAQEANTGGTEMAVGQNQDAVVRAQCIQASTGSTLGFRVEVINPSPQKNLVLVVRDNISFLFDPRLLDEKGVDISPMPLDVAKDKRGPTTPRSYRYDIVLPGTSHAWFIPVPRQVRADPRRPTNDNNLRATPTGEYRVKVNVVVGYFMQDKGGESIPEHPEFRQLRLTLPPLPVAVGPESFTGDVLKTYIGSSGK